VSDKDNWDNPESEIPEDAVSPGTVLPKPARAVPREASRPVEIEPQVRPQDASVEDIRPDAPRTQPDASAPSVDVTDKVATPSSGMRAGPPLSVDPQERSADVAVVARPRLATRLLGLLVAAALGAGALLAYQLWGAKPEVETLAGCLDRTLAELEPKDDQKLRVVLVPLLNELETPQGPLINSALNEFQGDGDPFMQVQTVDCALAGNTDNVLNLASMVHQNSLEVTRRTGADVLVWGEVLPDDQRLDLRINYSTDSQATHFATEDMLMKTNFSVEEATVLSSRIWSVSRVLERMDADVIARGMTVARDALLPISENSQPGLSVLQLGSLYHSLGETEYVLGAESDGTEQLLSAIEHYGSAGILLDRYTFPDKWAQNQNDLGVALMTLGLKGNQDPEIRRAISAFQEAIIETPRSRNPVLWGQLQARLAEALKALGTREANNQMLAAAISAYRLALTVQDRGETPVQWATAQYNLGTALQGLGQRDGDPAILQDAISSYRAALEVRTAEAMPNEFAITQINLGSTLMTVGARNQDIDVVGEAVTAYRAAIGELDQQASAVEWATAQHSLGNALAFVAEQEEDSDKLEEALKAFTLALEAFDRDTDPTRWAVTQNNIGNVLHTLGDRRKDLDTIAAAIAAYEAAVSVLSETAPAYAERVVESLSRAQVLQQTITQNN
jgi:tetratricopeptide (TPR) repeat protein